MAEFFLNHDHFMELRAAYDAAGNPGGFERKGIVFLHVGGTARIAGVKGTMAAGTGRVNEIPNSIKNPCPYPPPCLKDAQGICLTDENGNFIIDENDANAEEYF